MTHLTKKDIYIYGTGSKVIRYMASIALQYNVKGFVDSDEKKHGSLFLGFSIIEPDRLKHLNFDFVLIVSSFSKQIQQTLDALKVSYVDISESTEIETLQNEINLALDNYRAGSIAHIPRAPLKHHNIDGAQLLTNRNELLRKLPSEAICAELGVANGDFTSSILEINQPKELHLVDVWQSERYNETLFNNVKRKFEPAIQAQQVLIHRKLSTEAFKDFPDNYFDWIYIDTTHCYEGTKAELELYAAKIKKGGVIAGHDYILGNWAKQYKYGVIEAVHEFCANHGWRIKYLTMDIAENQSFAIERM